MALSSSDFFIKLNNGVTIPVVGLGVWAVGGSPATENAVTWALESGYRHIDTAAIYGNEQEVGTAILKSGIPRKEIFVTTKLWNDAHGRDSALKAFETSLRRLQMDYVDLYLVHWPFSGWGKSKEYSAEKRKETWQAMEEIYRTGKAKAIGVSNYTIEHLEEMKLFLQIQPTVNQVEFHPFLFRKELMEYCHSHQIALVDYCPLARGRRLSDERITAVAKKYNKTNAQVMLRWGLQHGNIVIPKSAHRERIKENFSVFDFELSEEDMLHLDALNENFFIVNS